MKALISIAVLILTLVGVFLLWLSWKEQKELQQTIQFWLPQLLLVIMIIVTILYVSATFKLVEETKKLRPPVRIAISYLQSSDMKKSINPSRSFEQTAVDIMSACLESGLSNPKKDMQSVIFEVRNVGEKTIYDITFDILITLAGKEYNFIIDEFPSSLKKDEIAQLLITGTHPAVSTHITTKKCTYSDGTDSYNEYTGSGVFNHEGLTAWFQQNQSGSIKPVQKENQ